MALTTLPDSFSHDGYDFHRLGEKDIKLLKGWLAEPHMSDWWSPSEDEMAGIENNPDQSGSRVARYIVSHGGRPFAYIQCYDPAQDDTRWDDHPQEAGTYGIDQFIGDAQMIGFGHGTNFIKAFITELKTHDFIKRLIVAPSPDNAPAIRCYNQAGFRKEEEIERPDETVLLMSLKA